jgi:hypothetical protein
MPEHRSIRLRIVFQMNADDVIERQSIAEKIR